MAFQIKSFLSSTASMVNRLRATTTKLTDFNVGAIARTLLEAVAQEIDELYQQMLHGLIEAIPVATYKTFDFPALAAQPTTGPIRTTILATTSQTLISSGTVFTRSDAAATYTATADTIIAAGDTYADVPVACTVAGTVGNCAAGTTFTLAPAPAGFVSASNISAFTNGSDAETADQTKARFQQFVQTLSRATIPSLAYALAQKSFLTDASGNVTEKVATQAIIEPYTQDATQPVGLVNCYIHNGVGNTSQQLVQQTQSVINGYTDATGNPVPGYKAAGVHVVVAAASEQTLNLTAVLTVADGYSQTAVASAVQSSLYSYILSVGIGLPFLFAKAYALAMGTPGVIDCIITTPTGDVTVANGVKLMPGTLDIFGAWSATPSASASTSATLTTAISMDAQLGATSAITATLT